MTEMEWFKEQEEHIEIAIETYENYLIILKIGRAVAKSIISDLENKGLGAEQHKNIQ